MQKSTAKTIVKISLAFFIGIYFLWLSLKHTTSSEIIASYKQLQLSWLFIALLCYSTALAIRAIRWRILLCDHTSLSYKKVLNALLIGYAVNNILPARIGELFRANFCKTQYGLSMSYTLGSIVLERLADGILVLSALILGLLLLHFNTQNSSILFSVTTIAGLLFSGMAFFVILLSSSWKTPHWIAKTSLANKINSFRDSIKTIRSYTLINIILLSIIIWLFELTSLWSLLCALHITLTFVPMLIAIGIISLSTLLPSPPGYLGTLQFAYAILAKTFGFSVAVGITVATVHQLFLFLPLCVVGLLLLSFSYMKKITKSMLVMEQS